MGLEEFKELYNSSIDIPAANFNIVPAVNNPSENPLNTLLRNTRYSLYIYPGAILLYGATVGIALGFSTFIQNPVNDILITVLLAEFSQSVINYLSVKKLLNPAGDIKDNLTRKITVLKRRYKWYYIINVLLFLLMPLYVELDLHFRSHGLYHGVGKINIFIRLAWYIVVFGCLFVIKKEAQRQQFGQYLDRLNTLLQQLN